MIQRYDLKKIKYTDDYSITGVDGGDFVLYKDHIILIDDRDKKIVALLKGEMLNNPPYADLFRKKAQEEVEQEVIRLNRLLKEAVATLKIYAEQTVLTSLPAIKCLRKIAKEINNHEKTQ